MTPLAFYRHLLSIGLGEDAAYAAAAEFEASEAEKVRSIYESMLAALAKDEKAEDRRRKDRERKAAAKAGIPQNSADSAECAEPAPLSLAPSPQTPQPHTHTPPEITTRTKATKRVPAAWAPSPSTVGKLSAEGFTSGDLERALTRMRDHEFKTARCDWDAAYRNWVRADKDRQPRVIHERSDPLQRKRDQLDNAFSGFEAATRQRALERAGG